MIPFDLQYYLPGEIDEAVSLFNELDRSGKEPLYYSGGTEIITLCRQQKIRPGALIDLKGLEMTRNLKVGESRVYFGANLTLGQLSEQEHFPMLAHIARRVADRTIRNRLTLGGNICGRLPYRETILAFLVLNAEVVIAGPEGTRQEPLKNLFNKRLQLKKGEFLMQLAAPRDQLTWPFLSKRREKHGPVDYPLFHMAALLIKGQIKLAVSGLCAFPFCSDKLDNLVSDSSLSIVERVEHSLDSLPGTIRDDHLGSAAYRRALWRQYLAAILETAEEEGQ